MSRFNFIAAFLLFAGLSESKRNFIAKQYKIDPEIVDKISEYDPTPKKGFTAWLVKVFMQEPGDDNSKFHLLSTLTEPLSRFVKLTNSPEFPKDKRDIGTYSAKSLLDLVGDERKYRRNLSDKEIERMIMTTGIPGAELIWDGGGFKMWKVTNSKYARFLSSNTSWCTAQPNYSKSYCTSGTLYPIYYLGKPFAQGHINEEQGALEFLNSEDEPIDILNDTTIAMLKTIDNPIMETLKRKIFSTSYLNRLLDEQESNEGRIDPKFIELVRSSNSLHAIAMVCRYTWWEEGWDLLLDHPDLFINTVKNVKKGVLDDHPEIAEEVLSTFDEDNLTYRDIATFIRLGRADRLVDLLMKGAISDTFDLFEHLNSETAEELRKALVNKVNNTPTKDAALEEVIGRTGDVTCQDAYWKKFIKKPVDFGVMRLWRRLDRSAAYRTVAEEYRKFPKVLEEGQTVRPGPDWKGAETETTGKVVGRDGNSYTIKWEDDTESQYVYDKGESSYPIIPTSDIIKPATNKSDTATYPFIGARVRAIHDENWHFGNQDGGGLGTIRSIISAPGERWDVSVEWDNGGVFYYNFKNIEEAEPRNEAGLPSLVIGSRVVKGPSWAWGNDDRYANNNEGTVVGFGRMPGGRGLEAPGWVTVRWDDQDPISYDNANDDEVSEDEKGMLYRYGVARHTWGNEHCEKYGLR